MEPGRAVRRKESVGLVGGRVQDYDVRGNEETKMVKQVLVSKVFRAGWLCYASKEGKRNGTFRI